MPTETIPAGLYHIIMKIEHNKSLIVLLDLLGYQCSAKSEMKDLDWLRK